MRMPSAHRRSMKENPIHRLMKGDTGKKTSSSTKMYQTGALRVCRLSMLREVELEVEVEVEVEGAAPGSKSHLTLL